MSDFNFYEANTSDVLDTRDIIARIEELRDEVEAKETGHEEAAEELASCEALMAEMAGRGGDEDWEGNWYPVTMIRDSYFEDAMDEMLEDIGALQPFEDRPSFITITIDYIALQQDYTSVEVDGVTYWYR